MAYTFPGIGHKLLRGTDVSYGVYIYHGLLLNIMVALGHTGDNSHLYFVIGLTFLMAFLSWKLVEKPFINWKKETIVKA
jgi:peptidoglycan/LPS O-acetylase OafA/YrhL